MAKYGKAPEVRLGGNLSATFSYIAEPLNHMLLEILKNAMRSDICSCIVVNIWQKA